MVWSTKCSPEKLMRRKAALGKYYNGQNAGIFEGGAKGGEVLSDLPNGSR